MEVEKGVDKGSPLQLQDENAAEYNRHSFSLEKLKLARALNSMYLAMDMHSHQSLLGMMGVDVFGPFQGEAVDISSFVGRPGQSQFQFSSPAVGGDLVYKTTWYNLDQAIRS